jgi:protein AroM
MDKSLPKKIGIVTIGQSTRPDVVKDMKLFWGDHVEVLERGALDELTMDQVTELYPENEMVHLVTRMRDGTEVVIAKEKILPFIDACICSLNREKVDLILLLCVGSFPEFESSCLVIEPQKIVNNIVEGLVSNNHHLGVIIPIKEQQSWVRASFSSVTPNIHITSISPYSDKSNIISACELIQKEDCHVILLYCMGFDLELASQIRQITGKPVMLSNTIVARVIGELLA